jgi:hypothetical protein
MAEQPTGSRVVKFERSRVGFHSPGPILERSGPTKLKWRTSQHITDTALPLVWAAAFLFPARSPTSTLLARIIREGEEI